MREMAPADYVDAVAEQLRREGHAEAAADRERLSAAGEIAQEKAQTLTEVWPLIRFLFEPPVEDPRAWEKVMSADAAQHLEAALSDLREVEPFDAPTLEARLTRLVESLGIKPRELYQPLRVAITGTTVSPGIFESLAALGRQESIARIEAALTRLRGGVR
jgi:glutamyl-tRNA synthetase